MTTFDDHDGVAIELGPVGGGAQTPSTLEVYPLAKNARGYPVYLEGQEIDLSAGQPGLPVSAEYPLGLIGGMGLTRKVAPNAAGYAFSDGMDWTNIEGRLSPAQVFVNPTVPPVDELTFGFEAKVDGTHRDIGSFNSPTVSGAQVIPHSLNSVPLLALFWGSSGTLDGAGSDNGTFWWGATDGTNEFACSLHDVNNQGTSASSTSYHRDRCVVNMSVQGSHIQTATFTSWDADAITITWSGTFTTAYINHFMVIGGSNVSAEIVEWATQAGSGDQVVTTTFLPKTCIHAGYNPADAFDITASTYFNIGAMDDTDMWALSLEAISDEADPGGTGHLFRKQTDAACIRSMEDDRAATFASFSATDFTVNWAGAGAARDMSTIVIGGAGLRTEVGDFVKQVGAMPDAEPAEGGVTNTTHAYLLFGMSSDAADWVSKDGLMMVMGGAVSKTLRKTAAIAAKAGEDPTNSSKYTSRGLTFIDDEDNDLSAGLINAHATTQSGVDMEQAGWLNWNFGADNSNASRIFYIAFGDIDNAPGDTFVYVGNGSTVTKLFVDPVTGVITEEESKGFSITGTIGRPAGFNIGGSAPEHYWPLGDNDPFVRLTAISERGGADTWDETETLKARAFAVTNKGASFALVRAHSTNKIAINTAAPGSESWGSDTDVGSADDPIVDLADTGVALYVGKRSNLFEFQTVGFARQLTRLSEFDIGEPSGYLYAPSNSRATFYHHNSLFLWNDRQAIPQGPDINPLNRPIPGITHVPVRGQHLQTVAASDRWVYSSYKVTEAGSTVTYVLAGEREPNSPIIRTWHTYFTCDDVARVFLVDSKQRLWFSCVSDGSYRCVQLGKDGGPDSGRNNTGYGAISETVKTFYAEETFGVPFTLKQLRVVEVKAKNLDVDMKLQFKCLRDNQAVPAVPESIGGTIEDAAADVPLARRFWSDTNNTAYAVRLILEAITSASYDATPVFGSEMVIELVRIHAFLRPLGAREVTFMISTRKDEGRDLDAEEMRTTLQAFARGGVFDIRDPDGVTKKLFVTSVVDTEIEGVEPVEYALAVRGVVWVDA